jgi:hypothetical protein
MAHQKDYTGQIVGNRLILSRESGPCKDPRWKNQCLTCGYVSIIGMSAIRKVAGSKQCTKCMSRLHRRAVDVQGQAFGEWTVIGPTLRTATRNYQVLARCSCGTEREQPVYNLIRGLSKSCGCTHRTMNGLSRTPVGRLVSAAKLRTAKSGVPFALAVTDLSEDGELPSVCPVLGIPLEVGQDEAGGATDNSPSIDQIIPGGGYVPGNVRIISWKANRLKSNATIEDLEAILAYMKKGASRS